MKVCFCKVSLKGKHPFSLRDGGNLREGRMHNPYTIVSWKKKKVKILNMRMLQSHPEKSDFGDQG